MKKVFIIATVLVLAITLTACGEKTAEKTAEKAIETSTGGAADVDIDDDTVSINTNAGSMTVGEEVDLPDNFPSDIYVIEGTVKTAMEVAENESFSVTIETSKSVSAARTAYEEELVNDGWTITGTMDFTSTVSVMAEKDNRTVTVSINEVDDVVTVAIGTSSNEE